jgi:uncharacterized iron-regulated protein
MVAAMKLLIAIAMFACVALLGGCATPLAFTRPVVLLGEVHDNAAQHALRLRALETWLAQGARPALLMEQFDRDRQADIDRVRARATLATADELIDVGSPGRKGWDWALYKPYIELALQYKLPIKAVNVGRDEARKVMREGLSAAGFDEHVPADVVQAQTAAVLDSHCGMIDAQMAARMALAQVARDQSMARAIDAYAAGEVLLLAGNGHVRKDIGVVRWLSPAARARTQAIGVLEDGDERTPAYDLFVFTPPQPRADPCAMMKAPATR